MLLLLVFVNDVPDLNTAPGSHKNNMLETVLSGHVICAICLNDVVFVVVGVVHFLDAVIVVAVAVGCC